jgi:hypothetical protein
VNKDINKTLKKVQETKELNKVHDTEKLLRFIKGDKTDDDRFM